MAKSIRYSEPADYFPKDIQKKAKIGQYATTGNKSTPKKKKVAKKK